MSGPIRRAFLWTMAPLTVLVIILLLPVASIEAFCQGDPDQAGHVAIISDQAFQRAEANSYLTYPEWHIVYAYEGLAHVLSTGDEFQFSYLSSVLGFWRSFCALNRKAGEHGGGDLNVRGTIHTIGVSFTLEMAMKALYEETLGRLFAAIRGNDKSPQDAFAAQMAADYARFLRQVPWYNYDFATRAAELWRQPLPSPVRGWERRLALGLEWQAKAQYAKLIAGAAAAAGAAPLRIRSVVEGMSLPQLQSISEVDVVDVTSRFTIIETPRYRKFTEIVQRISAKGGTVVEIAGNDDVMVSMIEPSGRTDDPPANGELIARIDRDGYTDSRLLVSAKVIDLGALIAELNGGDRTIEHIYDY